MIVLRDERCDLDTLSGALARDVRDKIGAIAALKIIVAVRALPKTRSGKIVRKALREAIAGRSFSTATIDDVSALESCLAALRQS